MEVSMTAAVVRPVAIKIDEDMKVRVKRLAEARHRTPHYLMREAITHWPPYARQWLHPHPARAQRLS
jgi:predicted transcriptional regulator